VRVIGVDASAAMLQVARESAEACGVGDLCDFRHGDMRRPPVTERVPLVTIPFRALLHMETEADRRLALGAARDLLLPGGRLVFDVFAPGDDDIAETQGQWLEREPGIFERADWDTGSRTLTLGVRGPDGETRMTLAWISVVEWAVLLDSCGFDVVERYGWFDRRPWRGGEDSVWVAERRG
jgi:SAM-dependent methyltransferase